MCPNASLNLFFSARLCNSSKIYIQSSCKNGNLKYILQRVNLSEALWKYRCKKIAVLFLVVKVTVYSPLFQILIIFSFLKNKHEKHFHRVCPALGIYWVKGGWMWESELSAVGAVMTMSALRGCVWQCVSAVRWMLANLAEVLEVTALSTEIHTLCPCPQWVTWCSLSGNPRWPQLLFELALSTQSLYWTWIWGQGAICSGQGLLGMVLDRGKNASSDCAPCVCSRQFTFVKCPGVWSGWPWEQNTALKACEKQVSENNRIVSCLSVTIVEYYSSYSMYLYLVT